MSFFVKNLKMKINNIHCLALNYRGVGEDNQSPIYFLKSTSCLLFENGTVPFPKFQVIESEVWTEVELGILITETCTNVEEFDAINYIGGFFIAGDITCGNIHGRDHHLAFSKARTGFCPISTHVRKMAIPGTGLEMSTYINGDLTQRGNTTSMILNPYLSISYISKIVTLQPGDIILTGTPLGADNNKVKPGDSIKHTIEGLGELNYKFGL